MKQGPEAGPKQPNKYGEIPNDPYKVLGVTPQNTKLEIRAAYRKLSRKYHSDTMPDSKKDAEEWFHAVSKAYDIITNPNYKRSSQDFKGWNPPAGNRYRESTYEDEARERERTAQNRRNWEASERAREEEARAQQERERQEAEAARAASASSGGSNAGTPPPPNTGPDAAGTGGAGDPPPPNAGPDAGATTGPDATPNPEEERRRETEAKVVEARNKYVEAKVKYKSKDRENYAWFKNIRAGLGFENTTEEELKKVTPRNMEEVKTAVDSSLSEYIQAKVLLKGEVMSDPITDAERMSVDPRSEMTPENLQSAVARIRLVEQAEKEWAVLQEQMIAAEKAAAEPRSVWAERLDRNTQTLQKGFKLWSKLPPLVRTGLSAALIGGVVTMVAAPILGAAGAAGAGVAATKMRGIRGLGSAALSGVAGAGWDRRANRLNTESREKNTAAYLNETASSEERERKDMEARERAENVKRQQRLKKAAIMMGTGVGAGVGSAFLEDLRPNLGGSPDSASSAAQGGKDLPNLDMDNNLKDSHFNPMAPKSPEDVIPSDGGPEPEVSQVDYKDEMGEGNGDLGEAAEAEAAAKGVVDPDNSTTTYGEYAGPASEEVAAGTEQAPQVLPVNVESSPKGFMQDIIDLKSKVKASYEGQEIPKGVQENLLNKSYAELAKEYGMYKAEGNLSGMSMKGAHLGVDTQGHLVYEYQGKSSTMFDYETGKMKTFEDIGGKMFTPKVPVNINIVGDEGVVEGPSDQVDYKDELGEGNGDLGESATATAVDDGERIPSDGGLEPEVAQVEYGTEMGEQNGRLDREYLQDTNGAQAPEGARLDKVYIQDSPVVKSADGFIYNGQKIGHEEIFNGKKVPVLEDKFMEGKQDAEIRQAFNGALARSVDKAQVFGENHQAVPFERDGMIDIANKVAGKENEITVFLNGKKIAEGVMVKDVGPSIELIDDPIIKPRGWLMRKLVPDTVYERAFKIAKKVVEEELTEFYTKEYIK